MRVFVTGASGWIGSAVTAELLANGHEVLGLARSDRSAAAVAAAGADVVRGDLDDPEGLAAAAAKADAVVHLAFKHDFGAFTAAGRTEEAAVRGMLDALAGSDRPFLLASGLAGFAAGGEPPTELDSSPHEGVDSARGGSENLALSYVDRGVRAVALRFAPTVHGAGDPGFTAQLVKVAKERGVAGYIGDGANRWAAVHRSDAARLTRLALDGAPAGTRVHAVAEEGLLARDIAAAIGDHLGLPTASIDPRDAAEHFGWIGGFFGVDAAGANARTRQLLGWAPTGPGLIADIAAGGYSG
ncbi:MULTISPECIES: SDR family oxidoreductase [unclassified Saccharopolyspora]|uniref:SDR family oxidoreductase n=1 Tax=unclassified Saccharopolyspora TaxID=2646250 RepID=UPI001CD240E1|nr:MULTISPECIES: SDR family oxidoreductase [unclassified Saccharopolyspora]MCA1192815.1 SDR family oxidoreductase [Saccharopolyspora sp. 6V]MCA1279172.1 SDR family oxidoreductase [Saccharopolyspora sp. 7B]